VGKGSKRKNFALAGAGILHVATDMKRPEAD